VSLAGQAGARRLVLFHHLPERDDEGMDRFVAEARRAAAGTELAVEVLAATEGMQLSL
jgi:ribonuclease BN (tRNA processing enzyme)